MKCTNCGKNNAVVHYHFNLNGQEREAHLCEECAGKLAPERQFAAQAGEMFGHIFDDGFFSGSVPGNNGFGGSMLRSFFGFDPFEDVFGGRAFSPFAMLAMPRIEISFPEMERSESRSGGAGSAEKRAEVDPELSKRRQLNELRARMKDAAENEEYEKAAELRNKIRALENEGKDKD